SDRSWRSRRRDARDRAGYWQQLPTGPEERSRPARKRHSALSEKRSSTRQSLSVPSPRLAAGMTRATITGLVTEIDQLCQLESELVSIRRRGRLLDPSALQRIPRRRATTSLGREVGGVGSEGP